MISSPSEKVKSHTQKTFTDLKAARSYVHRLKWPVFPCQWITNDACSCGKSDCTSSGKHPLTAHGVKDATTDPEQIRGWWTKWPSANIGVPTGAASGFDVLDIDPKHGGDESLDALIDEYGLLPETVEQITGSGGRHILFRHREGITNATGGLPVGLDVRGEGGYILVAPSNHISGRCYEWELSSRPDQVKIADWPEWLLMLVKGGNDGKRAPAQPIPTAISEGARNNTLTSLAGTMRRRGMSEDAIFAALKAENAARCQPPLSENEVRQIARSVIRYPAEKDTEKNPDHAGVSLEALEALPEDTDLDDISAALEAIKASAAGLDRLKRALWREKLIQALKGFKQVSTPAKLADAALDEEKTADEDTLAGKPLFLTPVEPWPETVDGAELLNEFAATFQRFLSLPDGAAATLALWALYSHVFDSFDVSPRLALTSATKRCGKSTALRLLDALVRKPMTASNITAAAVFRAVEAYSPTLLLDEMDTFIEGRDELRGVLNAGHLRSSAFVVRTVGDDHAARMFRVWAPVAAAMIGRLPDTLADRSMEIRLSRRAPGDQVERMRLDRMQELDPLRQKAARWAADYGEELKDRDPDVPGVLHDRAADNWRPLLAIADVCGADWPAMAREAARTLSGAGVEDADVRVKLLADIRDVFKERTSPDWMPTADILDDLHKMEGRPWGEWGRQGKPMSAHALARQLDPFGIKADRFYDDQDKRIRGYPRDTFKDVWNTYFPAEGDSKVSQVSHANNDGRLDDISKCPKTGEWDTLKNAQEPHGAGNGTLGTLSKPECDEEVCTNPSRDALFSEFLDLGHRRGWPRVVYRAGHAIASGEENYRRFADSADAHRLSDAVAQLKDIDDAY